MFTFSILDESLQNMYLHIMTKTFTGFDNDYNKTKITGTWGCAAGAHPKNSTRYYVVHWPVSDRIIKIFTTKCASLHICTMNDAINRREIPKYRKHPRLSLAFQRLILNHWSFENSKWNVYRLFEQQARNGFSL